MSALYMLSAPALPAGSYPVLRGAHRMTAADDFSAPFANGFAPPTRLLRKAVPRRSPGHMTVLHPKWILNGKLLDLVEKHHGPTRWALGSKRWRTENTGDLAPCAYGYDAQGKLVAMLAPMRTS